MKLQYAINSSTVRHSVSAEFIIAHRYDLLYVGTEGHVLKPLYSFVHLSAGVNFTSFAGFM
jgi:hypothetical protein